MSQDQKTETMNYLETNVNNIIKPLMKELILKKPDKVCDFIEEWIKNEGREIEKKRLDWINTENDNSHLPSSEDSFVDPEEDKDDYDINKIKEK